jgi:hypothetical protein
MSTLMNYTFQSFNFRGRDKLKPFYDLIANVDGPPEGAPVPVHPEEPQLTSPIGPDGIDKGLLAEVAGRLFGSRSTS